MSGGQHRNDESGMGRAGRVNVKRKEVERRESNQPNVQLRRHTGVLRKTKN